MCIYSFDLSNGNRKSHSLTKIFWICEIHTWTYKSSNFQIINSTACEEKKKQGTFVSFEWIWLNHATPPLSLLHSVMNNIFIWHFFTHKCQPVKWLCNYQSWLPRQSTAIYRYWEELNSKKCVRFSIVKLINLIGVALMRPPRSTTTSPRHW